MAKNTVSLDRTAGGIPVFTETIPGAVNSGFMVAVNTGSRDETEDIFGISHLLEHVVFRATDTRTSFQMSKEIEGAGGEMNAFTAKEMTAFYAVTIKDTAEVAKELVSDIVVNPLIAKKDVDLEKKIVLQEISMCENEPDSYIHDLFDMTVWKGHELAQSEAGTRKVVKGLTDKELRAYYEDKYRMPNLTVFACGAVDKDDVLEWAETKFEPLGKGQANKRSAPTTTGSTYKFHKRKEDHCYTAMGFRAYDANSEDRPALQLLSSILGSGSSSRLFQNVREKKALVYSIYNVVDQCSDAGTMGSFMSSTEENVLEAIETTAATYRELKENGITEGELGRAKNLVKGALTRYLESTEHRLYWQAKNAMLTGKPESFLQRLEALDAVTEEDVMRVAEDVMKPEGLNIVMYGKDVPTMKGFDIGHLDF